MDERLSQQIRRPLHLIDTGKLRARHGDELLAKQRLRDGAWPDGIAIVDRRIQGIVLERKRPRARVAGNDRTRAQAFVSLEPRDQPLGCKRREHAEVENPCGAPGSIGHDSERRLLDIPQNRMHFARIAAPGVGQDETLANPVEQLNLHRILNLLDEAAHRALRKVQLLGGAHDAAMTRRALESDQCGQ